MFVFFFITMVQDFCYLSLILMVFVFLLTTLLRIITISEFLSQYWRSQSPHIKKLYTMNKGSRCHFPFFPKQISHFTPHLWKSSTIEPFTILPLQVTYADAHKQVPNEGVVEFASYTDMKTAIEKLDDTEINGRRIRVVEDKKGSRRSRSRSRSGSKSPRGGSRSRSRSKENNKSRSRSLDRN